MNKRRMSKASIAIVGALILGLTLGGVNAAIGAEAADPGPIMLAQAQAAETPAEPAAPVATREEVKQTPEDEFSFPLSVSLSYALMTDYIFRGVNFSEYAREGREDLNHQLTVSLALDLSKLGLGEIGTVGFDTWFEWFAGQKNINPQFGGGQNLQEVDYTIWYSYDIEAIKTNIKASFLFYLFPNTSRLLNSDGRYGNNNDDRSQEWNILLSHNDAWMWKWLFPENEDGILNPTFLFAQDLNTPNGEWMELGISHTFAVPGIDNLTVTPGYTWLIQCNYWKEGFFVLGDQWSLSVDYDLTPVLNLPKWAGSLGVGGKLYYLNAWDNFEREGGNNNSSVLGQDEFWGGMTVTWSWGG